MPEVTIDIGGRPFNVACQEGEEHFLQAAAGLLDNEAKSLMDQIGRLPESRMLLMAGLMLADKTAGTDDQIKTMENKIAQQEAWIEEQVPQCGYCQSGQIMQAASMLSQNPNPSDTDIDNTMSGNLCRCMAYPRIKRAIKSAASKGGA